MLTCARSISAAEISLLAFSIADSALSCAFCASSKASSTCFAVSRIASAFSL